jgi:adenylate cyclase
VPQIMVFRAYGVSYVFFFLAASTLSISPGLVLFTWVSLVAALWGAFLAIIAGMDRTVSWSDLPSDYTAADYIALLSDPDFIRTGNRIEERMFLRATAAILALATRRAPALVRAEAEAQAARVNLARYVPPDLVDDLAAQSEPFGPVRRQTATILFVDRVGFTTSAENLDPAEVIDFLRIFHARVAEAVFAYRGTLKDFIGDEVLAVFGTPVVRDDDAARAVACADSIRHSIADWNLDRQAQGEAPVRISLSLHTGEVVVGTTGTERRLKFTVIGDTVNIACRLQSATRSEECEALYSMATLRAAGVDQINPRVIRMGGHSADVLAVSQV